MEIQFYLSNKELSNDIFNELNSATFLIETLSNYEILILMSEILKIIYFFEMGKLSECTKLLKTIHEKVSLTYSNGNLENFDGKINLNLNCEKYPTITINVPNKCQTLININYLSGILYKTSDFKKSNFYFTESMKLVDGVYF